MTSRVNCLSTPSSQPEDPVSPERGAQSAQEETMNCLSFRRELLVDPWSKALDLAGHARSCETCARARDKAMRFEQRLASALHQVCLEEIEQDARSCGNRAALRH